MTEMYCDLQSRGVKRKFVEDDDSCDRSQRLPSSDAIATIGATPESTNVASKADNPRPSKESRQSIHTTITSRILEHSLNLSAQHFYVRQRQQIFNISICKLNRFRQSSDPSLLRSVLVCNGLKALERELCREGIKINFGPQGVSFTPPVSIPHNITLDPPPSALNALVNQNNNNNNLIINNSLPNETIRGHQSEPMKRSSEESTFVQIDDQTDESNNNPNGEYEKYLLDLYPSSGRVTPFHKSLSSPLSPVYESDSSIEFSTTPLSQSPNSAFWGSDEASDRLTQLNWSSVFNTSTTSSANNKSIQSSAGPDTSPTRSEESAANKSTSSSSFTTLLPPSATTSSSTATTTTTSNSMSSAALSPTSVTSALLSQNSISSQSVINSQSLSQLSVISANSITFSTTATNDEIFGDIDLSLYDFDLLTPLSPPNVKLAPITAEELIRNMSSSDSNCFRVIFILIQHNHSHIFIVIAIVFFTDFFSTVSKRIANLFLFEQFRISQPLL